jgi:hypothetical protein
MLRLWWQVYPLLRWLALAALILLFAQAMPFDPLAILFAGDLLTYLEVATAFWLAARVTRLRWTAVYARFALRRIVRRARVRARRAVRRTSRLRPPSSDDERRAAPAFAFA